MAFRVFIDTDILLDFTLKREAYGIARQLMEWVTKGKVQAFITSNTITITSYWLTKVYGATKAREILEALLAEIQVIDAGHEITVNALHSRIQNMEQALQYHAALHHKLDYFITRDKDLEQAASAVLPVVPPDAFINNNC